MDNETSLRQMSVKAVAEACAENRGQPRVKQAQAQEGQPRGALRAPAQSSPVGHESEACLELFRRAIKERDEEAWNFIMAQYSRIVFSWVSRNPSYYLTGESVEDFAQDAFLRMWRHLTPDKFDNLSELRSLLAYLKMCVNSAIVDFMRRQNEPTEELQETMPGPEDTSAAENLDRAQLWQMVAGLVQNDKEWLVVRGLFVWGYKPNELCTKYDTVFRDVKEVYSIRENVMNRLRRDRAMRAYFGSDEDAPPRDAA